ncbi:MAG: 16S rRNA (cytidine(1402)-2'-O)-methyltransferase [Thermoanaerobaculia bacterium]
MSGPGKHGELRIVGTPIGNLQDLSPRALDALREADAIFCEDTRVTGKLASRFGLTAPRVSCPAPKERARVGQLLRRLAAGQTVALVSDAGMPLLSDPGGELVAAAAAAGYPVRVVPGPSAPAAALAVSGLPAVPHLFLGFLPARRGERRRFLEGIRERAETLVWFEAPHRLAESLEDAAGILGPRRCCVARELTKLHEEAVRGSLPGVAGELRARGAGRGESTVVVEGARAGPAPPDADSVDRQIAAALAAGRDKRAVARELARATGLPSREIYARAVALAGRKTGDERRGTKGR